jgi:hypothetical protein
VLYAPPANANTVALWKPPTAIIYDALPSGLPDSCRDGGSWVGVLAAARG